MKKSGMWVQTEVNLLIFVPLSKGLQVEDGVRGGLIFPMLQTTHEMKDCLKKTISLLTTFNSLFIVFFSAYVV